MEGNDKGSDGLDGSDTILLDAAGRRADWVYLRAENQIQTAAAAAAAASGPILRSSSIPGNCLLALPTRFLE